MATLHLICGTISSGKTTYARHMMEKSPALLLSVDEVTLALSSVIPPENHDLTTPLVKQWLMDKAREALAAGLDVIFDWGFWKKDERAEYERLLSAENIPHVWHYIDISNERWEEQIAKRNAAVLQGETSAYFVDDGLKAKCVSWFEPPCREEIDVWYIPEK